MECQQTPEFATDTRSCKGELERVIFIFKPMITPSFTQFLLTVIFFLFDQQVHKYLLPNELPYGNLV